MPEKRFMPIDAAKYEKLSSFCSFQERSTQQVFDYALKLSIEKEQIPEYIALLIQNNYLNEERFAASFIRGKQKLKSWGKLKIKLHLKRHGIAESTIERSWNNEITAEDYNQVLVKILEKKLSQIKGKSPLQIKQACFRYAQSKGYSADEIFKSMHKLGVF